MAVKLTLCCKCCVTGAGIGGANGLYNGLKETKAAQLAGPVWRTQYASSIYV